MNPPGSSRRELQLAVVLCLVGSLLTLLAVRHAWASFATGDDLTIRAVRTDVAGSRIAGAAQAFAIVGLAGVAAIAATRRTGRVLVGLVVLLAGVVVVVDVAGLLADLHGRLARAAGPHGLHDAAGPYWLWPVLTLAGGALMALAGLLVAVRGRRWAALSASYEVPAARDPAAEPSHKAAWDSLDAGDDPTA